jgi:two-component system response regulator FixJ
MKRHIAIVDDDEGVCDALAALLGASGYTTQAFPTLGELRRALVTSLPDVILLDVRLPDGSGVDFLPELLSSHSSALVIVMTGHGDVSLAVAAMKAGARDFLEKPFDPQELVAAIEAVLAFSKSPVDDAVRIAARTRLAALTPREREVLEGLVNGASSKEIARHLSLSPRTVEAHRANLMSKAGARSLSALLRLAILAGIRGDGAG